jgi:hypothetical protein
VSVIKFHREVEPANSLQYRVLVGKPEVKRPLEIPKRRWEEWIRMDVREIDWGAVEWIHLAQDR